MASAWVFVTWSVTLTVALAIVTSDVLIASRVARFAEVSEIEFKVTWPVV